MEAYSDFSFKAMRKEFERQQLLLLFPSTLLRKTLGLLKELVSSSSFPLSPPLPTAPNLGPPPPSLRPLCWCLLATKPPPPQSSKTEEGRQKKSPAPPLAGMLQEATAVKGIKVLHGKTEAGREGDESRRGISFSRHLFASSFLLTKTSAPVPLIRRLSVVAVVMSGS